jgi:heptosyltransferase-2
MNTLIIKLGATGDVVRTTPLLNRLDGKVTWLTAEKNLVLLDGLRNDLDAISWDARANLPDAEYDLVINLEDSVEAGLYLQTLKFKRLFGAYADPENNLRYTDNSRRWFDLSLISVYGREQADKLKFQNRYTYQELIFDGLGLRFAGESYLLPAAVEAGLAGDVALAADSGPVWPMKKWAYFDQLKKRLEERGLKVNRLPERSSLLEHLSDVRNHRCLVGGDSLPMHFALGSGKPCVTLFTCTSPWEIYEYGIQRKIISPLLEEFFYKRTYDDRATTAIGVDEVFNAVMDQLEPAIRMADPISVK